MNLHLTRSMHAHLDSLGLPATTEVSVNEPEGCQIPRVKTQGPCPFPSLAMQHQI